MLKSSMGRILNSQLHMKFLGPTCKFLEGGALMNMQEYFHGDHSNQGSIAAYIEAWHPEDCSMSPSGRSRFTRWCLSSRASVDALLCAQAFGTTANKSKSIAGIDDSTAHTFINITQLSSSYASSTQSESELPVNRPRHTESFLVIAAQVAIGLCTVGSTSSSLSRNAYILKNLAVACNGIGFLCCLYGIFLCGRKRKPGIGARVMTGVGYGATSYGLLAIMCMQLLDKFMLWTTVAACITSFPALATAFWR